MDPPTIALPLIRAPGGDLRLSAGSSMFDQNVLDFQWKIIHFRKWSFPETVTNFLRIFPDESKMYDEYQSKDTRGAPVARWALPRARTGSGNLREPRRTSENPGELLDTTNFIFFMVR